MPISSHPGGIKGGMPIPRTPLGGGNPAGRALGHYGTQPPAPGSPASMVMAPKPMTPATSLPTSPNTDLAPVRGAMGGIRSHPRLGGIVGKTLSSPGNL
jgi:hypothetical protein